MENVWTKEEIKAVQISVEPVGIEVDRGTAVLLPGYKYTIDLSIDGKMLWSRERSDQFDDRESML